MSNIEKIVLNGTEYLIAQSAEKTFANPVTAVSRPDPTIWRDNGWFYLFSTFGDNNGKNLLRSKNLIEWEDMGYSPLSTETFNTLTSNYNQGWAPSVCKIGNKWVMYVSLFTADSNNAVAVLTSDKADGQFAYYGIVADTATYYNVDGTSKRLTNVIDQFVIQDIDGTWYMFCGSYNGFFRFQLANDGLTLANTNVATVAAHTTGDTREGTYLLYRRGYWYYFYSAGNWANYTYHLLVCRSASLTGTFVDKNGNGITSEGNTILSSVNGDVLFGPGHNGDVFVDSNDKYWMPYHCHYNSGENRYLCIQELLWDDNGWPYFKDGKPAISNVAPSIFN